VDGTYVITFEGWDVAPAGRDVRARSPRFRVRSRAVDRGVGFLVQVLLSRTAAVNLMSVLDTKDEDDPRIDEALTIFGLAGIQARLREGSWEDTGKSRVEEVRVSSEDVGLLVALAREKSCDYQLAEGRDLYCVAASPKDDTLVGSIGVRGVAPTSRATCAGCNMPDSRLVCSHLHHPQVFGFLLSNAPVSRQLMLAMCDIGQDEIQQPHECRPGGNHCWTRLVEPPAPIEAPRVPPRALLEALDYLDTTWRLAFDKRPLVRMRNAASTADLTGGCSSREEFQSRLSALTDLIKGFEIGDDLLAPDDTVQADHTVARLRSCLRERFGEDAMAQADSALSVLTTATRVRVALQHEGASGELPKHMAALGVRYPPNDWGDAWDAVRSQVTAALRILADAVRALALGQAG
jgi:hypothetical protein